MSTTIENGIRNYLDGLGKPDAPVVDREAVQALKNQIRDETDNLNKLKLIVALQEEEKGHAPDRSGERAVFIANAKAWADESGITAEAFQAFGVPDDDLRAAGFTVTTAARTRSTGPAPARSTRAPRIALDQVLATARGLASPWKLTDLGSALDRDPATVRNYVAKLIQSGDITIVGDDPNHDGRGRAPKLYTCA